jgi:hypothetical protein
LNSISLADLEGSPYLLPELSQSLLGNKVSSDLLFVISIIDSDNGANFKNCWRVPNIKKIS